MSDSVIVFSVGVGPTGAAGTIGVGTAGAISATCAVGETLCGEDSVMAGVGGSCAIGGTVTACMEVVARELAMDASGFSRVAGTAGVTVGSDRAVAGTAS